MRAADDQPTHYPPAGHAKPRRGIGRLGCLIWGMVGLLLAGMMVAGAAFAGWNSGISLARRHATVTAAAELARQCDHLQTDLAAGKARLAQRRIEFLRQRALAPTCLIELVPRATALYLDSLPSAAPQPTLTATPQPTIAASRIQPTIAAIDDRPYDYDLDVLLAEAEADMDLRNYQAAIDTLDAISAIDESFRTDHVDDLHFIALTEQASALFRSGRLAEGIVLARRAETYGDVQTLELNYEWYIAELYLNAQRLKIANPAESVRLFSQIVYDNGLRTYQNGLVISELQEAHRHYGDALSWRGEPCQAQGQYQAALDLRASPSRIDRASVRAQRDQAAQACDGAAVSPSSSTALPDSGEPTSAPIRPTATIVPVGQTG